MRIYTKCPCCGKTIFLVMEMELGSSFGSTYQQEKSNDWNCLNNFLNCLQNSQGNQVYLGINEREETKIPEEYRELILNWTERGYKKPEETTKPSKHEQPKKQPLKDDKKDWFNIHEDFHSQLESSRKTHRGETLKEQWSKAGFTYEECKDWINIGLKPYEIDYAVWLRDIKKLTPDWVLNYGDDEKLRKEYQDSLPINWE